MNSFKDLLQKVKSDSHLTASLSSDIRNKALANIVKDLEANKEKIFKANKADMDKALSENLPAPIVKRLLFGEEKLRDALDGLNSLISLEDPLFKTLLSRQLDTTLHLEKITCPIGVIGVIFESRPDALIQIASLCIKSGNCSILKGGREGFNTNRTLYHVIYESGLQAGMPEGFLTLVENRSEIQELLKYDEYIDLLIPRGSNEFVQYIMENSKIPVMGHADGVCHIYADESAELEKSIEIIIDAKTQYVAACNTAETLLVHSDTAPTLLPQLKTAFDQGNTPVKIKGCKKTQALISCDAAKEEDYGTEYLDYVLNVRVVDSLDEAISHINDFGSHHTDCILSEREENIQKFMLLVDSAGVYHNCSTRFADGFRYGFGAEVGISTGKLHARGPVGLDGLVTYKYKLSGNGHTVKDYAEGAKQFHFKDLNV